MSEHTNIVEHRLTVFENRMLRKWNKWRLPLECRLRCTARTFNSSNLLVSLHRTVVHACELCINLKIHRPLLCGFEYLGGGQNFMQKSIDKIVVDPFRLMFGRCPFPISVATPTFLNEELADLLRKTLVICPD